MAGYGYGMAEYAAVAGPSSAATAAPPWPVPEPQKDYSAPLQVDCSIEYELPEYAKPPQGVKIEPLLMIHPVYFRRLESMTRVPFVNNMPRAGAEAAPARGRARVASRARTAQPARAQPMGPPDQPARRATRHQKRYLIPPQQYMPQMVQTYTQFNMDLQHNPQITMQQIETRWAPPQQQYNVQQHQQHSAIQMNPQYAMIQEQQADPQPQLQPQLQSAEPDLARLLDEFVSGAECGEYTGGKTLYEMIQEETCQMTQMPQQPTLNGRAGTGKSIYEETSQMAQIPQQAVFNGRVGNDESIYDETCQMPQMQQQATFNGRIGNGKSIYDETCQMPQMQQQAVFNGHGNGKSIYDETCQMQQMQQPTPAHAGNKSFYDLIQETLARQGAAECQPQAAAFNFAYPEQTAAANCDISLMKLQGNQKQDLMPPQHLNVFYVE